MENNNETNILIDGRAVGKVEISYSSSINYAMVLNHCDVFTKLIVSNETASSAWHRLTIHIGGEMFCPSSVNIPELGIGTSVSVDSVTLMPNANKLMMLTEAVETQFTITINSDGKKIFSQSYPITIMAFDMMQEHFTHPELIASFVLPNNRSVPPILHRAAEILGQATGDPSLDSYLSGNSDRIIEHVKAVYKALEEQKIIYSINPAEHDIRMGQKIRLVDNVLATKLGNCIELSLLMCSCLEAIHIPTVIIAYQDHVLIAIRTIQTPMLPVGTNYELLEDYINKSYLIPLETTVITNEGDYDNAVRTGHLLIDDFRTKFCYYVDVIACRRKRILPLPMGTFSTEQGWVIDDDTDYSKFIDDTICQTSDEIRGARSLRESTKLQVWERKLLDLTLRNPLINMRPSSTVIPLSAENLDEVMRALADESLHTLIKSDDAIDKMKALNRASRISMEENGANTLFLSVGTMRWFEEEGNEPHFAPIVLIPLEIVRHSMKRYTIRRRDDEHIINITLMELMKQVFGLEVPDFTEMFQNDTLDVSAIFSTLRSSIAEQERWQIAEEGIVGIFSFSKFVMWHDIHTYPDVLADSPVVKSLMDGKILWDDDDSAVSAQELDHTSLPSDLALPIDVDSSQLEAVAESGKGRTFILYGPPGTGKSQTITNIIANAMYQGKRVLFVAEKKAALDVVQSRLSKIGLEPFCLELHSNKGDKKSFLSQMERVLNIATPSKSRLFKRRANDLMERRQQLNGYIESLHAKRANGLSLYDCINMYSETDAEVIAIDHSRVDSLSVPQIEEICDMLRQLDVVAEIIGTHPASHPLRTLLPRINTAESQNTLCETIRLLPNVIEKSRRKAKGWLNRLFLRKTELEILNSTKEWTDFEKNACIDQSIATDTDALCQQLTTWNAHTDKLRSWYHFSLLMLKLKEYPTDKVIDYYMNGHDGRTTADTFRRSVFCSIATNIVDSDQNLRSFNGLLFHETVESYRKLIREFQELTQKELFYRLALNIPTVSMNPMVEGELYNIRRWVTTKGRGLTIRRILEQIPTILPQLAPCMLMSPLSVAQYLRMDSKDKFDLVIFDEASQIPTCEAVGAMARGKAVVVVGDPKQMPPTNFFNTNTTAEDEIEYDDLESILDDCISLSMASRYLSWHYRSRHESLIAYSNMNFYDGKLTTFPSVDDRESRIVYRFVNGFYDFGRTRSNKAEAKSIVDDIINRLHNSIETGQQPPSMGVVAFSKAQSTLIEDMLAEALAHDSELDELTGKMKEGIFVKNLENVQGDERDIIFFSIGYGPDRNGKVSMNFGPLNQQGGERRLNVAVTRARQLMVVTTTMRSDQIDLERTSARGVKCLKTFLEYAESGRLPVPVGQVLPIEDSNIVGKLIDRLSQQGYECHTNVGRSQLRVNIAVADPQCSSKYALGILIDDEAYRNTHTARDREMVQPAVLRSLGWKLHRVRTLDWFENPERVVSDIISKLPS